jgi:hypothetical protein
MSAAVSRRVPIDKQDAVAKYDVADDERSLSV